MLKDTLGYKLISILEAMRNNAKETLAKIDITHGDFIILLYISENEGVTQAELANISKKDRNVIGRHIDSLEKKEFIKRKRTEFDRRSYTVNLTEKGQEILSSYGHLIVKSEQESLKKLNSNEKRELYNLLDKIVN